MILRFAIFSILSYAIYCQMHNTVPRLYDSELVDLKNVIDQIIIDTLPKSEEKRVISFALYGSDRKYTYGAIKNVELAKLYYPGWICRFYGKISYLCTYNTALIKWKNSGRRSEYEIYT